MWSFGGLYYPNCTKRLGWLEIGKTRPILVLFRAKPDFGTLGN